MAGKTKRTLVDQVDTLELEVSLLKYRNINLAKGLSEKSTQYQKLLEHTQNVNGKLLALETENSVLKESFTRTMNCISTMSMELVKIREEFAHHLRETSTGNVVHSPVICTSLVSKVHVVKPMGSRHTIFVPPVKLSPIPEDDVSKYMNDKIKQSYLYLRDCNKENISAEADQSNLQQEEYRTNNNNENSRLHVIEEEEQSLQSESVHSPKISGVFKDVRNNLAYQEKLTESEQLENDCSLEGSRTSSYTTNNEDLTLSMFLLSPNAVAKKISTPYAPDAKDADKENISVAKSKKKVVLNRLSPRNVSNCHPSAGENQMPQQTIKSADTTENDLHSGRSLRAKKPKSLKEPSLQTKMRRST